MHGVPTKAEIRPESSRAKKLNSREILEAMSGFGNPGVVYEVELSLLADSPCNASMPGGDAKAQKQAFERQDPRLNGPVIYLELQLSQDKIVGICNKVRVRDIPQGQS